MQKKRALVTTALLTSVVGLWGCTASTGSVTAELPSAYQQNLVTQANHQAVQSMSQLPPNTQFAAVLQTGTRTDVPSGILQPGSIILRRSTVVEKPIPAEELAATMQRLANEAASRKLADETPQILAMAEQKIAATASEQQKTAEQLRADLAAAEQRQKNFVVSELAFREQTTEQKLASMKERQEILLSTSKDYARAEALAAQLAAQNTSIQQAQESTRLAQASAQQAEARAKEFAAERLATLAAQGKLAAEETKGQIAAATAENKLAIEQTKGQIAAAAADNKISAQATAQELKAIREAQAQQQQVFQNTIMQVSKELKAYGDNQLTSLANETRSSISQTAAIAQQSTAELTQQTSTQLAKLRAEAANRSEQLATSLTNQFAENLNALAEETEAKRLTPEQISNAASSAAEVAVTSAAPQFRALALQTLADSQDYIRTVAQESLTDDADPAVQEALQKAAKNVITKDDQVVFAIREALTPKPVAPKLPEGERTVLGDGPRPDTITADVMLNAKNLGVAALAGTEPAAGAPDHLASLNPGARSLGTPRHRQDWIDLRKYRVVVHEDGATLEKLMSRLMAEAVPYTGPWQVKWKLKPENQDLTQEIFSLDAETTFEDFVTYLSQYVQNARGVKLSFNLFDAEHILIISD